MSEWNEAELKKISQAEELDFQSEREDGSLRDPVTIWVVRVADSLYIRAIKGRRGWFRGILSRHQGRIDAGGVKKKVTFVEESDTVVNVKIDQAYKAKYGHYNKSTVDTVLTPAAVSSTLKLLPHPD
jgi:hypothetical protein